MNKYTYRLIHFYARPHQMEFETEQQARNWLAARRLTSRHHSYTEMWKMENGDDGEQVAFFEDNQEPS